MYHAKKGTWSDRIYLFYFQILSDTYTTDHGGLRHHHHHHDDDEEEHHEHEHVFPISRKPGIMGWGGGMLKKKTNFVLSKVAFWQISRI